MKNPNDKLANKNFSLRKWFFVGGGGETQAVFSPYRSLRNDPPTKVFL